MTDTTNDTADLLYGVPSIAKFLGLKPNAVYHLVATGRVPHFKIGKTICARRAKLIAAFDALEEQQAEVA
jgi:hypothetical protein